MRGRGGGVRVWEVLEVGGEVCRDGGGVGDQEMEDMRSEERVPGTKVQTQCIITCAALSQQRALHM